jgi:enoyl-[acyl-carrier protein] reductase III
MSVTPAQEGRKALEAVASRTDTLHQIVHCAAKAAKSSLLEVDPDLISACVAVNGLGLIYVTQAALPLLKEGSTIFYAASRGAEVVVPEYGPLGIPKALGEHIVHYIAPVSAVV